MQVLELKLESIPKVILSTRSKYQKIVALKETYNGSGDALNANWDQQEEKNANLVLMNAFQPKIAQRKENPFFVVVNCYEIIWTWKCDFSLS